MCECVYLASVPMPVGVHVCAQEEARTMYADPDEFAQEMVKMINEKEFRSALTASAVAPCNDYQCLCGLKVVSYPSMHFLPHL